MTLFNILTNSVMEYTSRQRRTHMRNAHTVPIDKKRAHIRRKSIPIGEQKTIFILTNLENNEVVVKNEFRK